MTVREATINDIKVIQDLYYQLDTDACFYQREHFIRVKREETLIKEIIESEKSCFLVNEVNEKVVGFALLHTKETANISCLKKQTYLYIQDFIIDIAKRGEGYGTELINAAKKWARDKKLEFIRLSVFPLNSKGIKFYEKHGLEPKMITLECEL